jgi:hypothetical protein
MTRRRSIGLAAFAASACIAGVVVSHDFYQAASFQGFELLCQRADESLWRDPSQGCTGGEDPRCVEESACADSTIVSEGWRHACTWFIFEKEVATRGEEPFYDGSSPGRGCLGRNE